MTPFPTMTFKLADPRTFDGNPYEAASRAVGQVRGLANLMQESLEPVETMLINAFMERQAAMGQEINAKEWYESAEHRNWQQIKLSLEQTTRRLGPQQAAAEFDPKAR